MSGRARKALGPNNNTDPLSNMPVRASQMAEVAKERKLDRLQFYVHDQAETSSDANVLCPATNMRPPHLDPSVFESLSDNRTSCGAEFKLL
jgi:hypothetical protein